VKIQPQCVVTAGKQTNKQTNKQRVAVELKSYSEIKDLNSIKKHKYVLSTIVQMLDVITSFNCNCYSPNDVLKK
jgi:hypothetical protein